MPTFTTSDGLELNYTRWEGTGGSRPVLLQHGIVADTNANWMSVGVVDALTRAGLTVVSLDARGHGRSAKPHDPARYSWAAMAGDLRGLIDELGFDEVSLVGYSMGAIIALQATTADPRIRRLAIGGVGCGVVDVGGIDYRAFAGDPDAALKELVAALLTEEREEAPGPGSPFRMLADALGADRWALAAVAMGLLGGRAAKFDLNAVAVPTLVLAGDRDPFAAEPERLAAAIEGARLRVVPGDHLLAVMDPAFAAALVEFLV